jgi:hypothetical protein
VSASSLATSTTFAAIALLVSACGAGTAVSHAPAAAAVAGGAASGSEKADAREQFLSGCVGGMPGGEAYCGCAWDQTARVLGSSVDLGAEEPDQKKVVALRSAVAKACGAKAPEALVKQNFIDACAGDRAELDAYCECSWGELRKSLGASELADEALASNAKFASLRSGVAKACSASMPEFVARDTFLKGCVDDGGAEYCACGYAQVKKLASTAEIDAGLFDKSAAQGKIDGACRKLKRGAGRIAEGRTAGKKGGPATPLHSMP